MRVLIGNTVKTEYADYPCASREEAEGLYMALREREQRRAERSESDPEDREPSRQDRKR